MHEASHSCELLIVDESHKLGTMLNDILLCVLSGYHQLGTLSDISHIDILLATQPYFVAFFFL
jgi:hypothetical protein